MVPRVVVVERPTEYRELLARHGTREQVRFFLGTRGRSIDEVEERAARFDAAHKHVLGAVPPDWRTATVDRGDLDRFLFEPDDIVVVLGQDGLVPNVSKYLDDQPVIGLSPEPGSPGVLTTHDVHAAGDLLRDVAVGRASYDLRTMARADLDDGQSLHALNEIFVGHRSHQSARYVLAATGITERQSSSGLIVATGTGATGWAASIARERHTGMRLPRPDERALALLVREPWPSAATGTDLDERLLEAPATATVTSELTDGGVVFADGIEADRMDLQWGQTVTVGVADRHLRLVA
jgi:NAD kinase